MNCPRCGEFLAYLRHPLGASWILYHDESNQYSLCVSPWVDFRPKENFYCPSCNGSIPVRFKQGATYEIDDGDVVVKSQWLEPLVFRFGDEEISIYTGRGRGDARIWQYVEYWPRSPHSRYSFSLFKESGLSLKLIHGRTYCQTEEELKSIRQMVLSNRVGDVTEKDIDDARMEGLL